MFEIREKDMAGRLGILTTSRGKVQTPTLMPVIHPIRHTLPIEALIRSGTNMIITNAHILFHSLRKEAITRGVHELLGYSGPIMTDSGAYQLMTYGNIETTNREITLFQEAIGVDFGVPLDLPLAEGSEEAFAKALDVTILRVKENVRLRSSKNTNWVCPIQGGPFPSLVEKAARIVSSFPFQIFALGSVVPLMQAYKFSTVCQMILSAKQQLPISRPFHLFGTGHPMFFSLAVLCGVDLFDSAAYALYAKSGRYLTPNGTYHLKSMDYFPCSCEACINTTPREIKSSEKEEIHKFLALHNLMVSFQEIRNIQQAIIDGRLLDLVHSRAVRHPMLLNALHLVLHKDYYSFFEGLEPTTKRRALFLTNDLISNQPYLVRIRDRLKTRFFAWGRVLRVVDSSHFSSEEADEQLIIYSPVYGLIPSELSQTFPFYQKIVGTVSTTAARKHAEEFLAIHAVHYEKIIVDSNVGLDEPTSTINSNEYVPKAYAEFLGDYVAFRAMIDFQYGRNAGSAVRTAKKEFSPKTSMLRRFVDENGELLATVRARDFFLIPSISLAYKIQCSLEYPRMRVVVSSDAEPFLREGRDAFSKFVLDIDPVIRTGDEILVVNESDDLLATGKAVLGAKEALQFSRGVAVKTRRGTGKD